MSKLLVIRIFRGQRGRFLGVFGRWLADCRLGHLVVCVVYGTVVCGAAAVGAPTVVL